MRSPHRSIICSGPTSFIAAATASGRAGHVKSIGAGRRSALATGKSEESRSMVELTRPTGKVRNLALATWAFAISFWAWNLIGPLGARYTTELGLTAGQKALLVAIPVLVGAAGRIVAGIMTDLYGGR